jgi:hypothetical protein
MENPQECPSNHPQVHEPPYSPKPSHHTKVLNSVVSFASMMLAYETCPRILIGGMNLAIKNKLLSHNGNCGNCGLSTGMGVLIASSSIVAGFTAYRMNQIKYEHSGNDQLSLSPLDAFKALGVGITFPIWGAGLVSHQLGTLFARCLESFSFYGDLFLNDVTGVFNEM